MGRRSSKQKILFYLCLIDRGDYTIVQSNFVKGIR